MKLSVEKTILSPEHRFYSHSSLLPEKENQKLVGGLRPRLSCPYGKVFDVAALVAKVFRDFVKVITGLVHLLISNNCS